MTAQPPANTAGLPAVLPAVPLGVMGVGMKKMFDSGLAGQTAPDTAAAEAD